MLDIAVHKNVRLSEVIVSEVLDYDHLSLVFHLLHQSASWKISAPYDKFTDWKRFLGLASEVIEPRFKIRVTCGKKPIKQTATLLLLYFWHSGYRTAKLRSWNLVAIYLAWKMLAHKRSLRKLWPVAWDPACKTAVNWAAKTIRRMILRSIFEEWETKVRKYEIKPHAPCPNAKSLMKRDGPKAPNRCTWSFRNNMPP